MRAEVIRKPRYEYPKLNKQVPLVSRFDSKKLLILMGVVIVTLLVDSQIGYIADFVPEQLSSGIGVAGFICIAIIFTITQYFILLYIKQSNKGAKARTLSFDLTSWVASIAQYFLVGIVAFVIFQIIIAQQYSIATLYASHVISYGLWIVILALLAKALFSWYRLSNRNIMVLVLALSMVAYVINGVTGIASYSNMLAQQKSDASLLEGRLLILLALEVYQIFFLFVFLPHFL